MQKHVNLVDLVKTFPTNIYFQNLASIQPRTSPIRIRFDTASLAGHAGRRVDADVQPEPHADDGVRGLRG